MCQIDKTPIKEQKIPKGYQWVFNIARKSNARRRASDGPCTQMCNRFVKMNVIIKSEIYKRTKIRNI